MVTWIRHRLRGEDGITLVEMLVALTILTVAVFALLGGLIAAAASVVDQQLRAEATRVATQALESARFADYDDLPVGDPDLQFVTTANGRTMTLTRTIAYMDASDPAAGTNEDVKLVTVDVSWTDRGRNRTVSYATAVAPPDPEVVTDPVLLTALDPGAVEVDADGDPVSTVVLTATPKDFVYLGNMTARWDREDGTQATPTLSQVPATNRWEADLTGELNWSLDFGESVAVEITVHAGARQGVAMLTLYRPEDTAPGPTLSEGTVSPDPILLTDPVGDTGNCGINHCQNKQAVTLSVKVTPFDDDQVIESVWVEYDLRDATSPTAVQLDFDAALEVYRTGYVPNSVQFAPGSSQPFNFYAYYDGGEQTVSLTVLHEVRHE